MQPDSPRVSFPDGQTGSVLLHDAMAAAVATTPHVFGDLAIPEGRAFKSRVGEAIVRFEAARAAADDRVGIARTLADHVRSRTLWGDRPLQDALTRPDLSEPVEQRGTGTVGWTPTVTYRGTTYSGRGIGELAHRLRDDSQLTAAAASALVWVSDNLLGAPVDLREHTFALLGAGAELAPTPLLLQAGARVLWVDKAAPSLAPGSHAGTVWHHPDALDLLAQTPHVHAAVARAADAGPVHLGLYAYAPGRGRELLLAAAMNAIADAVEPASIALLISPTTPGEVQPEEQADRQARRARAPRWQRALARLRVLPEPAHHAHGDTHVSRSIVGLQGPTYLAAQYLTKMMIAEDWATSRTARISANVAGITHTASLEHPLFLAGFLGAPSFGIEIFQPEQTRTLMALLLLHDLLAPVDADVPDPERARRLAARSVHGGVRSLPFELDPAIRVAAVLGLARRPGLLVQLARGGAG